MPLLKFKLIVLSTMVLLLSACGVQEPGGDSSATGSYRPRLVFPEDVSRQEYSTKDLTGFDCEENGVVTIEFDFIVNGGRYGPRWFPCSAHYAFISDVPAGKGVTVEVFANDADGNALYEGWDVVDIFGGQVTYGEDIQMHLVDPSTDTDIDTGTDTDADTDTDTDMEWTVEETTDGGIYLPELDMKFVLIEAGEFYMGSPPDELDRNDDEYRHLVRITQAYYMQETELTQAQWAAVMDGARPSAHANCDNCPVEQVGWDDIVNEFLPRLNALYGDRYDFNLPTEAQWEYAARAGTTDPFYFGETLSTDQANYDGRYPYGEEYDPEGLFRGETTAVKTFRFNDWGLYDMHGNVWEWCRDWYKADYYQDSPPEDPECTDSTSGSRVLRGGSWNSHARGCRSADRFGYGPESWGTGGGFRLVAPLYSR